MVARYVLNHMQIKARRGDLSESDRVRVRAISRTALRAGEDQLPVAVGCAVLLEEPEEVRELLDELSPVRRSPRGRSRTYFPHRSSATPRRSRRASLEAWASNRMGAIVDGEEEWAGHQEP